MELVIHNGASYPQLYPHLVCLLQAWFLLQQKNFSSPTYVRMHSYVKNRSRRLFGKAARFIQRQAQIRKDWSSCLSLNDNRPNRRLRRSFPFKKLIVDQKYLSSKKLSSNRRCRQKNLSSKRLSSNSICRRNVCRPKCL